MISLFKTWYKRRLSDPRAIVLAAILLFCFLMIYFFADLIVPILIAVMFASILDYPVKFLTEKLKFKRLVAVALVFSIFVMVIIFMTIIIIPAVGNQIVKLINDFPNIINNISILIERAQAEFAYILSDKISSSLILSAKEKLIVLSENSFNYVLASIANLVTLGIYAFLMPLMVFFMIKDKDTLIAYMKRYLPKDSGLASEVWVEMKQQIANYIRGKLIEFIVVAVSTYFVFIAFGMSYALLLSIIIGLSVLIPYIGVVLVTFPVTIVAFNQFGISPTFYYVMAGFLLIQLLDGNILVPLLFSGVVNLHPLIIIIAVIFFGNLWGFWGVFFAIPLATLVKAVVHAWPSTDENSSSVNNSI